MNLSLSKGGRPASVKNRAWHYCQMAWRGVCTPKALSRLAAFSPLLLLGMGQMAHAAGRGQGRCKSDLWCRLIRHHVYLYR